MATGPEFNHGEANAITCDLEEAVNSEFGERGKHTRFNTFLTGDDVEVMPSRVLLAKAVEIPGLQEADATALHGLIVCAMRLGGAGARAGDELARAFGSA